VKFMLNWRMARNGIMIGCIVLALSGCGQTVLQEEALAPPPAEETEDPPAGSDDAAKAAESEEALPFTYPLTGIETDMEAKDRPVMVMVENSPRARPQSGLDKADIVFEILAEGDITRFVAVYHSESPEVIGPVRSIRPYYVEIGDGLDALIVHAGWSQEAMNMLAGRRLAHFDQVYGDDAFYWRDKSRKAPHNLYTSVAKIREGADKKKYRTQWNGPILTFAKAEAAAGGAVEAAATGSTTADKVKINYIQGYYVSYEYDGLTQTYRRFMEGDPHKDKESGVQLSGTNILIAESKHRILDKVGRRSVDVFGPGPGYLLQNGQAQAVTWERKGGIIRAFVEGREIPLLPGKTWIHVIPEGSKVEFK
jgi:hypothetical protein